MTSNLESDWHCYKVHFSNEEHEDCIKQSSGSRFIFFMGHGGETKLHGACAVYGEMSVDVAASSENTNFSIKRCSLMQVTLLHLRGKSSFAFHVIQTEIPQKSC